MCILLSCSLMQGRLSAFVCSISLVCITCRVKSYFCCATCTQAEIVKAYLFRRGRNLFQVRAQLGHAEGMVSAGAVPTQELDNAVLIGAQ